MNIYEVSDTMIWKKKKILDFMLPLFLTSRKQISGSLITDYNIYDISNNLNI